MFVVSTRRVLSRLKTSSLKVSLALSAFPFYPYHCHTKNYLSAGDHQKLLNVKEVSRETTLCLATAHALVKLDDGTTVGDPMEKTTLDALEWSLNKGVSRWHINHIRNDLELVCR